MKKLYTPIFFIMLPLFCYSYSPARSSFTAFREDFDTLPPVVKTIGGCGEYTVNATEMRNGGERDDPRQTDLGIADKPVMDSILSSNFIGPIIDGVWRGYPTYKDVDFRWQVQDMFKDAFLVFKVKDMAGNTTIDSIRYAADSITINPFPVDIGQVRLGKNKNIDINVKSSSDSVIIIKNIYLKYGNVFSLKGEVIPPDSQLLSGDAHIVNVEYKPIVEYVNIHPNKADIDTLIVQTNCLRWTFPLTAKGVQPKIEVEDWNAGIIKAGDSLKKSDATLKKLQVKNKGTGDLTIYGLSTDLNSVKPFEMPPVKFPIVIAPGDSAFIEDVIFKPAEDGQWYYEVVFANDGEGPDSVSIWRGAAGEVSVPELIAESDELEIYPNPAQNSVLINIKTDYSAGDILLVGSTGRIHKNIAAAGEKNFSLDLRDLPSGIYNITLKANGKLYSRKLSIVK